MGEWIMPSELHDRFEQFYHESTVLIPAVGDVLTRSNANGVDRERQLQAAGDAIRNLPATVGPWRSTPAEALSETALRMLQCRAHASQSKVGLRRS